MTFPIHSFRDLRRSTLSLILLAAFAGIAGCGSDTSPDTMVSPPGWVVVPSGGQHAKSATLTYIDNGGITSCAECHGADLSGGTSKVSCFGNPSGCHHGPVAGWVAAPPAAQEHGAAAKRAPGSSGFVSCQICHGNNFAGTAGGPTCLNNAACHGAGVVSPHARTPWRGSPYTHTDTVEEGNAPVCYQCHAYTGTANPNNPHIPPAPAPTGTAPGCLNGTMCHNQSSAAPHSMGSTWLNAGTGFHGTDAKSDLASCQGCHGTPGTINFNGGSAPTACSTCHTASKAHPTDWQGLRTINGVTITHRTSGNRDVACAICHNTTGPGTGPNPSAPSCFSASFTNALGQARSCHSGGPGSAPHALGATWLNPATGGSAFHGTTAKANLLSCQTCHGTPPRGFSGGTGATTACTTCHTTAEAHPTDWQGVRAISTASITHRTSGNQTAACGICHSVTAPGTGPNPAAPSCFSSSHTNGGGQTRPCHPGGPSVESHLTPFDNTDHYSVSSTTLFTANCGVCHAVAGTSPVSDAPLCTTCHVAGSPLTSLNCTSCHGDPPSGATYPNVAGKHAVHGTLPGVGVCNPCHNGLDTGTLEHYNRANARPGKDALRMPPGDIAFLATYSAKSGPSAFNAENRTCSNVICHGGQTTPDWQTATGNAIDVPNACLSCHVSGTTQYNSYFSGKHGLHMGSDIFGVGLSEAMKCKLCHDGTKVNVSGHFQNLATQAFEQPARQTILPAVGYNGNSCNPQAGGLTGCHSKENW